MSRLTDEEKTNPLTTANLIARARCNLIEANKLINDRKMAVPEGYALVPIEPTSVMVDAGYDAYGKGHFTPAIIDCYRAMVLVSQKEQQND